MIDRTVAPDIVTHGFPGGASPSDHASYKEFFRYFGAVFSDMRYEIGSVVASVDRVAVRFTIEVTHTGPFAGVPATNRRVRFDGMVLYGMREGLIAETWLHVDEVAILAQIGAVGGMQAA